MKYKGAQIIVPRCALSAETARYSCPDATELVAVSIVGTITYRVMGMKNIAYTSNPVTPANIVTKQAATMIATAMGRYSLCCFLVSYEPVYEDMGNNT